MVVGSEVATVSPLRRPRTKNMRRKKRAARLGWLAFDKDGALKGRRQIKAPATVRGRYMDRSQGRGCGPGLKPKILAWFVGASEGAAGFVPVIQVALQSCHDPSAASAGAHKPSARKNRPTPVGMTGSRGSRKTRGYGVAAGVATGAGASMVSLRRTCTLDSVPELSGRRSACVKAGRRTMRGIKITKTSFS